AFLDALNSSGFVYYSQYETITLGSTLPVEVIKDIFSKASSEGGFPYTNDSLYHDYPEAREHGIAGIMIIPLFEKKQYFTAWFRKETHRNQKWIGAKDEKSEDAPKAERLKPRSSFTIHTRTIKGRSTAFDKTDVDTANRLNRMFLVYALDVQERMHISIQELEKQDNYRNEFLATLAHELRNPLGPIMSGASILETVDDEKTRKRVTAIINRQAEYMSKLINDLMDVSRITRGKVKLEFERLKIQDVLSDSLEIVEQQVKAKKHDITVNCLEEDVTVYGDKARLSQIFSNIIHNATKYTKESGKIVVEIRKDGVMIVVAVKDNGMGIPEDRLKDVFNMFTQIEAHSTHTKGGLGIGLTLVSKLVALHHGEVSVMSEGVDRGSTFEVRLPISKTAYEQSENQKLDPVIQSRSKVMFVDDNADLIDAYCLLAESMGVTALGITSPKEAVDAFKTFKPHSVFLDIGMPDIDGYQLVKMLKALPESENVKFYSQSGWGSEKYVEDSQAAGFDQHFVKPLSKDTIQSVLS
ncbi:MAG: ATP-binding protein, partial [Pseudomonadota bacterium]